jgi:carbonic anhydrase
MSILSNNRRLKILVLCLVTITASWMPKLADVNGDESAPLVPPAKALQLLLDGNQRYVSDRAERPNQRPSDSPQHPLAVVLSCSDSRVPPEIIFDQGVGNLFIVRVAGNTYDRLALQSIEYAVGHLGTSLIVVMGHDQCGAVTAALKAYPDPRAGPMLTNIYTAVREARGQPGDELSNAIDNNAVLMAKKLAHEADLEKKVKKGELTIQPARYILKTGAVKLLK